MVSIMDVFEETLGGLGLYEASGGALGVFWGAFGCSGGA